MGAGFSDRASSFSCSSREAKGYSCSGGVFFFSLFLSLVRYSGVRSPGFNSPSDACFGISIGSDGFPFVSSGSWIYFNFVDFDFTDSD